MATKKDYFASLDESIETAKQEIHELIINSENPKKDEIDITSPIETSELALRSYVTLDSEHVKDIREILNKILLYSRDQTQRRPLNFLMFADPGSGKSHFVKCIAERLWNRNISAVVCNMATFQNYEDFLHPIEAVRNLKVQDKLPILFIDEFDSDNRNYAFLLPLLWEGQIQLANRELKLGKIVIILAASKPEVKKSITDSRKMERTTITDTQGKLKDLISRINGGDFEIPSLELNRGKRDRRIDKICVAISLLKRRFDALELISWAFLKFIAITEFKYGVRSMTQLIDLIPQPESFKDTISADDLNLPLTTVTELKKSSLSYHIILPDDDEGIDGVVKTWNKLIKNKTLVRIAEKDDLPF
jgi:hypothetical protein